MAEILMGSSDSSTSTKTYQLGAGCSTDGRRGEWIRCIPCNRISYHPQDVAEHYCGACHRFHDEPERQLEVA